MPISPVVAVIPVPTAASLAAQQPQGPSIASAVQQALTQTEGGHGGGGGGHSVRKTALDAISQIAADTVKPKQRPKTFAERQAEIERMKREHRGQRDATDEREQTPEQRARRHPLSALF